MKKIARLLTFVLLAVAFTAFAGCDVMEVKPYVPSEDKYFIFTDVAGADGETIGCAVQYNVAWEGDAPETLKLPTANGDKPVIAVAEGGFSKLNVKSVTIPSSVKTIGANAFKQCKQLEKVYFYSEGNKQGCETIGDYAFSECTSLVDLDLPKSLREIGAFAFEYTALKSLDLPHYVVKVGAFAFNTCTELKNVSVAVNLAEVGDGAFSGCSSELVIKVAESNPYFYFKDGKLVKKSA